MVPLQASWRGAAGRTLCAQRLRAVIDIQRAFRLLKTRKLRRRAQQRRPVQPQLRASACF